MRHQCLERRCIQTEHYVSDQQQFMLCTLLQKEEAIAVALSYSFSSNHSFPGLVVCAHSSIEVSQEDEFVCPRCSRNHRIQIIIELVFDLKDTLKASLKDFNTPTESWEQIAQDRAKWRGLIRRGASEWGKKNQWSRAETCTAQS